MSRPRKLNTCQLGSPGPFIPGVCPNRPNQEVRCRDCGELLSCDDAVTSFGLGYAGDHAERCRSCAVVRTRRALSRSDPDYASEATKKVQKRYKAHNDNLLARGTFWAGELVRCSYGAGHEVPKLQEFWYYHGRRRLGVGRFCKTHENEHRRKKSRVRRESLTAESTCFYCNDDLYTEPGSWKRLELEHVIAKVNGGSDDPSNLVPACAACNRGPSGKHDRWVYDWLFGASGVPDEHKPASYQTWDASFLTDLFAELERADLCP